MAATTGSVSLLQDVGPETYRENAFRITGLAVNASTRDIRRQTEKLEVMARLGATSDATVPFLGDPADITAMRQATQRMRDPVRRLADELFWFWPLDGIEDTAMAALRRGDTNAALQSWRDVKSGPAKAIARHNLAVLAHARALDHDGFDAAGRTLWKDAYTHWRAVAGDDAFWRRLEARVRELSDPRLDPTTARRTRQALPSALLSISGRLAVQAYRDGRGSDAAEHIALMRASGFRAATVEDVLHRLVEPDAARIRTSGETAEQAVGADPSQGGEATTRFLDQADPLLGLLTATLAEDDPVLRGARDEVAGRVMRCAVGYGNATDDWRTTRELLERAQPIAMTPSVRDRIESNLETVRANLTYGMCWFCGDNRADQSAAYEVKMYGDVERPFTGSYAGRVSWKKLTVSVPRCATCNAAHGHRYNGLLGLGCVTNVVLTALAIWLFATGHPATGFALLVLDFFVFRAAVRARPPEPQPKDLPSVRDFTPIRERLDEGWLFGEKPPFVG